MPGRVHTDLRVQNGRPSAIESNYKRLAAMILAATLQLVFVSIFVIRIHVDRDNKRLQQELIFIIPSKQQQMRSERQVQRAVSRPSRLPPTPAFKFVPAPEVTAPSIDPNDLQRFGAALFGCAPENYQKLSPEMRARCPALSERGPVPNAPNLMGTPSHVVDNQRWVNALAHEQSPIELPYGAFLPFAIVGSILDGSIADPESTLRDPEKWPTEKTRTYASESFYQQEQALQAWNQAHGTENQGLEPGNIAAGDAAAHVDQMVNVEGYAKIRKEPSGLVFLDFPGSGSEISFFAVIFPGDTAFFRDLDSYNGKKLVVTGVVQLLHGRPEIIVKIPSQITKR